MSERSPLLAANGTLRPSIKRDDDKDGGATEEIPANLTLLRFGTIAVSEFVLIFVLTFGVSVITTIQSPVARDLHVTTAASWLTSAYLIAVTSVTPIAGKLCEIFSIRSYLLISTCIQAFGLLVTALARSFKGFAVGRVVGGVGSAAVTPVAFISVTAYAPQRWWGFLFGLINCGYTAGIAVGAVVGGALEPLIGWRGVFWVQVPVCLVAGFVAFLAMPSGSERKSKDLIDSSTVSQKIAKIDYLGVATLVGAVVAVLYTLASPTLQVVPIIIAIVLLALFVVNESRWTAEPIIPLAVISSRAMSLTGIATVGLMCARWEVLFYIPMYGIAIRGWTQSQAGLLLVPTNLGFGIGSVVVGVLHIRQSRSYYTSCLVCLAAFALEHFALSRLMTPDAPVWVLVITLFFNGFIAGAILTYNLAHLLYLTSAVHHVSVIPLNAMFRSLSGSLGSALSGGIFVRSLQHALQEGFDGRGLGGRGELIQALLSRPLLVQKLHGVEHEVAVASYATSIRYLITISCSWVLAVLILQAGTGWKAPKEISPDPENRRNSIGAESIPEREPLIG